MPFSMSRSLAISFTVSLSRHTLKLSPCSRTHISCLLFKTIKKLSKKVFMFEKCCDPFGICGNILFFPRVACRKLLCNLCVRLASVPHSAPKAEEQESGYHTFAENSYFSLNSGHVMLPHCGACCRFARHRYSYGAFRGGGGVLFLVFVGRIPNVPDPPTNIPTNQIQNEFSNSFVTCQTKPMKKNPIEMVRAVGCCRQFICPLMAVSVGANDCVQCVR